MATFRQSCLPWHIPNDSTHLRRPPHTADLGLIAAPDCTYNGASALALGDLVGELRGNGEQIAYDPEVGDFEDGGLSVFVDRDDGLGRLHASAVLNRAGDAERDVELRRDGLAGLPDLELVRVVAG